MIEVAIWHVALFAAKDKSWQNGNSFAFSFDFEPSGNDMILACMLEEDRVSDEESYEALRRIRHALSPDFKITDMESIIAPGIKVLHKVQGVFSKCKISSTASEPSSTSGRNESGKSKSSSGTISRTRNRTG
jgi:hypothetical protein